MSYAQPHVLARAAVDPEHLALGAAAGETEVRIRVARIIRIVHEDRHSRHGDDVERAPVAQRQFLDALRFDQLRHVGRTGFDQRRVTRDADGLSHRAEFEAHADLEHPAGVQRDVLVLVSAESLPLDGKAVGANRQVRDGIETRLVGHRARDYIGGRARGADSGAGNRGSLRVGDNAANGRLIQLAISDNRKEQTD